jgi:cell wall-associated NlpC family hydrolase
LTHISIVSATKTARDPEQWLAATPKRNRTPRYQGRHSATPRQPSYTPLVRSWTGRALALIAAAAVVLALLAYFNASDAHAASSPRQYAAMHKAVSKKGKPYRYGAAGPSSFDCSGLVVWAYRQVGFSLPRTTGSMYSSSKFTTISKNSLHYGDLVFFGTGHVELFGHWANKSHTVGYTFGAHHSGTTVSYRRFTTGGSYHPTKYRHVKGAG